MNLNAMSRFLCFLLALLMCGSLLVACVDPAPAPDDEKEPEDSEKPSEQVEPIVLATGGESPYIIVRSDRTNSSDTETKLCIKVSTAIMAVSDVQIGLTTDYEDTEGEFADRYEILIGNTTRPESLAAMQELTDENSYIIRVVGNKIVIAAKKDGPLEEAVAYFLSTYVGWKGESDFERSEELKLDGALNYTGLWIDPEAVPDDGNPKVLFGLSQNQADEYFGDILDGLFTGNTTETMAMKNMGSDFKMHFPDIVYVDGQYWAYYICYKTDSGKGGVGLAISNDGVNWTDKGCVLQPDQDYDCNGAYFAGVWLDDDGTFYLTYECKGGEDTEYGTLENVALATSDDGINWTKEGVILYKNKNWDWQIANVGTPDLYKEGDTWYLFFHGFDYVDCQVGVAYGTDLHNLTVLPEPIIATEDDTPYSGTVGRRDVIYVDGYYYMVYEVSTDQAETGGYNNAYWTHMFARSKDLINWETIGEPIVTQKNSDGSEKTGFGYDGPCWMIIGKHIYVYVRISNKTTAFELTLK